MYLRFVPKTNIKIKSLFVGGTGFYLKALTEGAINYSTISPATLGKLEKLDTPTLYKQLTLKNPSHNIKMNDRQRLLRALSVLVETGQPLHSFYKTREKPLFKHAFKILLNPTTRVLDQQIETRLAWMWTQNVADEVWSLAQQLWGNKRYQNLQKAINQTNSDAFITSFEVISQIKWPNLLATGDTRPGLCGNYLF